MAAAIALARASERRAVALLQQVFEKAATERAGLSAAALASNAQASSLRTEADFLRCQLALRDEEIIGLVNRHRVRVTLQPLFTQQTHMTSRKDE